MTCLWRVVLASNCRPGVVSAARPTTKHRHPAPPPPAPRCPRWRAARSSWPAPHPRHHRPPPRPSPSTPATTTPNAVSNTTIYRFTSMLTYSSTYYASSSKGMPTSYSMSLSPSFLNSFGVAASASTVSESARQPAAYSQQHVHDVVVPRLQLEDGQPPHPQRALPRARRTVGGDGIQEEVGHGDGQAAERGRGSQSARYPTKLLDAQAAGQQTTPASMCVWWFI